MFVDYVRVKVHAGDGGSGCISFRREKHVPRGGPDGGDGGKGGDIWFEADRSLGTLLDLQMSPLIKAAHGGNGQGNNKTGKGGADILVKVPIGSVVLEDGEPIADFTTHLQRICIARGGDGGRGNQHYATPTRQAPRHYTPGFPGDEKALEIELKQIADIGLVGLPNAGKSTLLAHMTAAEPKIAAYPFTTLNPNLGVMEDDKANHIVLADLPGLIEGASRGEGLGHRFLRHIERTGLLLQLAAYDENSEDPIGDILYAWELVDRELEAYSDELGNKARLYVVSKIDLCPEEDRGELETRLRESGKEPLQISASSGEGVAALRTVLIEELKAAKEAAAIRAAQADEASEDEDDDEDFAGQEDDGEE